MTIPVGTTHSLKLNYVEECERKGKVEFPGTRVAELVVEDWDVNDPEARAIAAEEQLGEVDDDYYAKHAMWFINSGVNAAVLVVFRPKVDEPVPS